MTNNKCIICGLPLTCTRCNENELKHKELITRIDEYFEGLSIEEFDEVLERSGINEIKNCEVDGFELKG